MVDQSIIDKLQKIKALADRAGTPEEAAAAAGKLQALLMKHNLTLEAIGAPRTTADRAAGYVNEVFTLKYQDGWRRLLLQTVANVNLCKMLYVSGSRQTYLVGEPHNVEAVKMTFEYLDTTIVRLSSRSWTTEGKYHGVGETKWKNNFRGGAADVVRRRLREQAEAQRADDSQVNALVVVTDAALAEATTRFHPSTTSGRQLAYTSVSSAYHSGKRAGETISLNRQVGEGNRRLSA